MEHYDIILYGGYGLGNFGDDILMVSFLNSLHQVAPQSTMAISVVVDNRDYLANFAKGIDILDRNLSARVHCKALIYGGGTQWYSFPNTTADPHNDEFRPVEAIKRIVKAGRQTTRRETPERQQLIAESQLALGIGIGPFLAGNQKKTLRELRKCDYIGVRDPKSLEWCNDHNLKQTRLRADICYADEYWKSSAVQKAYRNNAPRIGIVARDWNHTDEGSRYLPALIEAGKELTRRGYEVRYLIFSKLRELQTMALLDAAKDNYAVWEPKELSDIDEFLGQMAACDLIISARYHGIVAAATLGIPTIAIELEQKLSLVSRLLAPGCVLWNQPFSRDQLLEQVETALVEKDIRAEAMAANALLQKKLAAQLISDAAALIQL